jgi:monofunctional biosynthetic peptidoglycan transglycosylase
LTLGLVFVWICAVTGGVCDANPGDGDRVESYVAGDTMSERKSLIDFSDPDSGQWYVINDGVMGGISRSKILRTEQETGIFEGVLSLENNGGFASIRTALGRLDLSAYAGLEIRVRGDGRTYHLRLRTDDRFDGITYRAEFETRDGEWVTTRIPFNRFIPTFRGRTLRDVPPLDTARIHQVAFMIADKKPGPFRLEIDYVRAWEPVIPDPRERSDPVGTSGP